MGDWFFGCDVCQDVCPWNSRAPQSAEAAFVPRPGNNPIDLIALFGLDDAAFRERFRHTPLWRAKRRGLLRNAAIALGNRPTPAALPVLIGGLSDVEPLVRGACAWALGGYPPQHGRPPLESHRARESDDDVLAEIDAALGENGSEQS
jgi:epoxyqueuosine reductase